MQCLKCGKTTKDEQVFCPQCLGVMDNYPVKPDVRVQLPNRSVRPLPKKTGKKRRALSAEEQVMVLRSRQRRLTAVVALLVILLGVACLLLVRNIFVPETPEWGTNYTFDNPFD